MSEFSKCARCGSGMTVKDITYGSICNDCGDEIEDSIDYCDTCGDAIEGNSYGGQCADCSDKEVFDG